MLYLHYGLFSVGFKVFYLKVLPPRRPIPGRLFHKNPIERAVWVPFELTHDLKSQRVKCCKAILDMFRTHPLEYIATCSRKNCIVKGKIKPKLSRQKLTDLETMAIVSFTCKQKRYSTSVLHKNTTINSVKLIEYLKSTGKRFMEHRERQIILQDLVLQMDNEIPHASRLTQ